MDAFLTYTQFTSAKPLSNTDIRISVSTISCVEAMAARKLQSMSNLFFNRLFCKLSILDS